MPANLAMKRKSGSGDELDLISILFAEDGRTTINISLILVVGLLFIVLLEVYTHYK